MAADSEFKTEMRTKFSLWERHFQTILLAVVTTALMFTGKFMWDMNGQMAEMIANDRAQTAKIGELTGVLAAMQSNYVPRPEFNMAVERLRAIENRTK